MKGLQSTTHMLQPPLLSLPSYFLSQLQSFVINIQLQFNSLIKVGFPLREEEKNIMSYLLQYMVPNDKQHKLIVQLQ